MYTYIWPHSVNLHKKFKNIKQQIIDLYSYKENNSNHSEVLCHNPVWEQWCKNIQCSSSSVAQQKKQCYCLLCEGAQESKTGPVNWEAVLFPVDSSNTKQSWGFVSSCVEKKAVSAFLCVRSAAVRCTMISNSKKIWSLSSHLSEVGWLGLAMAKFVGHFTPIPTNMQIIGGLYPETLPTTDCHQ